MRLLKNIKNQRLKRNYKEELAWKGDLNDDCTAKWCGLMLRAEYMDDNHWWWCVYDLHDNEKQISSSNDYNNIFINGEIARQKAEENARSYLKNELVSQVKGSKEKTDIDRLILDLKYIGVSTAQKMYTLIQDFDFTLKDAKDKIFDAPFNKGLREQSEILTQTFLDVGSENADEITYTDDGKISSITFDLTKDNPTKKESFWTTLKRKIKRN